MSFELTAPQPPKQAKPRRVQCDERCKSARGPDCNCKCNGLYHGQYWNIDDQQNSLFGDMKDESTEPR